MAVDTTPAAGETTCAATGAFILKTGWLFWVGLDKLKPSCCNKEPPFVYSHIMII